MGAGVLVASAVAALALTGCTSMERPAATPEPTSYAGPPIGVPAPAPGSAAAPASPSASVTPSASATPSAVPGAKVSATDAPENELLRAVTRTGVTTPQKWVDVIVANRPYADTDTGLTKLRAALMQAAAPPDVVNKIASTLTP
jgi:hypothetical protein